MLMRGPPKELEKVVQDSRTTGQADFILGVGQGDADNELVDARGLLAPELLILEVDVVDDLGKVA